MLAVFDALPSTEARRAILRTLRSGVDWRGQVITMLDRAYLADGVPTLIIWGRRDAIIPLGHGRLAQAALPGSELEVFDEAGHFPHHTDPQRFAAVVRDFVERTPPASFDREDVAPAAPAWAAGYREGQRGQAMGASEARSRWLTADRSDAGMSVQDQLGAAIRGHQPLGGHVGHRGVPDLCRAARVQRRSRRHDLVALAWRSR